MQCNCFEAGRTCDDDTCLNRAVYTECDNNTCDVRAHGVCMNGRIRERHYPATKVGLCGCGLRFLEGRGG